MANLQLANNCNLFSYRFSGENQETLLKTQGIIPKTFQIWAKNSRIGGLCTGTPKSAQKQAYFMYAFILPLVILREIGAIIKPEVKLPSDSVCHAQVCILQLEFDHFVGDFGDGHRRLVGVRHLESADTQARPWFFKFS